MVAAYLSPSQQAYRDAVTGNYAAGHGRFFLPPDVVIGDNVNFTYQPGARPDPAPALTALKKKAAQSRDVSIGDIQPTTPGAIALLRRQRGIVFPADTTRLPSML